MAEYRPWPAWAVKSIREVEKKFGLKGGTYKGHADGDPGHDMSGNLAVDFWTENKAKHDAVLKWFMANNFANAKRLGLSYMISWDRIVSVERAKEGIRKYGRYGKGASASQRHTNHVHMSFNTKPPKAQPTQPETTVPTGAKTRVTFEGKRTTARSVRMIKEARYLFRLRGGGQYPSISQGGYNKGGVSASAGTHDRDAHDYGTKSFSTRRRLLWEWCVWEVGFASWRRPYIAGTWPSHDHALPKGGDLSSGARAQIVQWHQGDDALRSDRNYPRILSSGFKNRTWESYRKVRPSGLVDLSGLVTAFKTGGKSPKVNNAGDNDVQQVQRALNHFLDSKLDVDGVAGSATKAVYKTYQSRKYGVKRGSATANGIPGKASLEGLGFKVQA